MWAAMDPIKLSVLMPVFNERFLVRAAVERVLAFNDPRVSDLELVIVDDGSTDGTPDVLRALAAEHPEIRFLPQEVNRGKGDAVRRAIEAATGDIAVVQDADLEYDPSDWSHMLTPFFEAEADAVYGSRFLQGAYRRVLYFRHTLGNRLLTVLSNLATDLNLSDMETCYKMVRMELLRSIPLRSNDFSFEPEITSKLAKRGARIFEVPIRYAGRTYEEGKKIRLRHAVTATAAIVKWWLLDDLYRADRYGAEILTSLGEAPRFNRWMADTIRPFVGHTVLEIGAGIGNITFQLLPRQRYLATDVNPDYLQFLRNRAHGRPYFDVMRLDVCDEEGFGRLDARFDTVICLNVLEHVADEAAALSNLYRALQPGGRAIVLVPRGRWLFSSLDRVLGHHKRYTKAELADALRAVGFDGVSIAPFNHVGTPGWLLNGKILRRRTLPRLQMKLLNVLLPAIRPIDRFLPWPALSLVAVAVRPPAGDAPALG